MTETVLSLANFMRGLIPMPSTRLSGWVFPNRPCSFADVCLSSQIGTACSSSHGASRLKADPLLSSRGWGSSLVGADFIPRSPRWDCKFGDCFLPPSIQEDKNQETMLGLSELFSSPSLREPRSPISMLQDDKPIRQRLLIRVMKGEGTRGKGRREGMWQRQ